MYLYGLLSPHYGIYSFLISVAVAVVSSSDSSGFLCLLRSLQVEAGHLSCDSGLLRVRVLLCTDADGGR